MSTPLSTRERLIARNRERRGESPSLESIILTQSQVETTNRENEQRHGESKPKQKRVNRYSGFQNRCRECNQPFVKTGHNHVICDDPECAKSVRRRQQAEWREKQRAKAAAPKSPAVYTSPTIEAERSANAARKGKMA